MPTLNVPIGALFGNAPPLCDPKAPVLPGTVVPIGFDKQDKNKWIAHVSGITQLTRDVIISDASLEVPNGSGRFFRAFTVKADTSTSRIDSTGGVVLVFDVWKATSYQRDALIQSNVGVVVNMSSLCVGRTTASYHSDFDESVTCYPWSTGDLSVMDAISKMLYFDKHGWSNASDSKDHQIYNSDNTIVDWNYVYAHPDEKYHYYQVRTSSNGIVTTESVDWAVPPVFPDPGTFAYYQMLSKSPSTLTEQAMCEKNPDGTTTNRIWTAGKNDNYINCGGCYCCSKNKLS